VPFYIKSGVFTMPEFLERRYDAKSRWYLTTVSITAYVLTKVSVTLFAGSLLLNQLLGWDMYTSAIALTVATGIYTIVGGLTAVIYTELMQTFVLIGGAALLTILGLVEVGGWSGLQAKVPADYFSMFKPMSDPNFPWTGIVFGAPILGIWYWCTDQYIVQRVLSAKGISDARAGTIFSGFLKILPVFILVLPGVIAHALYPDVSGDQAYPALVSRLLPSGVKGIVIASLLAALMSSLAACFNSASTLFTIDVYKKLKPNADDKTLVTVGRISTGVLVLLGILWVPFIRHISAQLYVYLQSVQAYISPPIAAVFLFGVFWPRANGKGSIAALLTGLVAGAARLIFELMHKQSPLDPGFMRWMVEINFLHFAVFLFILCSIVLVAVSLMSAAPSMAKIEGLVYRGSLAVAHEEPRAHRRNVILSVALVAIVFVLWGIFF
jgi:SSS family solute:Na+ symporter